MKRRRTASLELRHTDGTSSTHLIDSSPFVVGRGDSSTGVTVQVCGKLISRTHIVVKPLADGVGFELEDTGSSNGTWLSDDRLAPHVPHRLRDGDLIALGSPHTATGSVVLAFRDGPCNEDAAAPHDEQDDAVVANASDSDVDSEEDEALRDFFSSLRKEAGESAARMEAPPPPPAAPAHPASRPPESMVDTMAAPLPPQPPAEQPCAAANDDDAENRLPRASSSSSDSHQCSNGSCRTISRRKDSRSCSPAA